MGKKKDDGLESPESMAEQLQPLIDDDAFLTELSLGNDPSDGADELAALFLSCVKTLNVRCLPRQLLRARS